MIVERIQTLHEDYIRLAERFKALWTFQQFLRGVHKMFFSGEPETTHDFPALYEEIRGIGERVHSESSREMTPRLRAVVERLDLLTGQLRAVDRSVSPSFVRRFFERVRPQDEKTALQLLRFYFSQPETDVDVIDKVNFLATVAAAGSSDPASSAARPRAELHRLFESVASTSVWPRPSDQEATAIAYVINEVAGKVARAQTFEELMGGALIEEFRAVKRRIGSSLAHPDVLSAAACANLSTRSAFSRLYRSEEKVLAAATTRIEGLERKLRHGGGEEVLPEELRHFRETRDHFRREALASNLRANDVVLLKTAIDDVLQKFDLKVLDEPLDDADGAEPLEGADSQTSDESFWSPFIGRILAVIEIEADGRGALQTGADGLAQLRLEPWELQAIRRVVTAGGEPKSDRDRTLLRSVALRLKAEEESELLRTTADGPRSIELLRRARASIARAPELDGKISHIIRVAHEAGLTRHVRAWTRTRFRLLRSIADLWLMQDRPRTDRRSL
jgi:hypothetical protein